MKVYHNQQTADGRSPSILENHLTSSDFPSYIGSIADTSGYLKAALVADHDSVEDDFLEEYDDADSDKIDFSFDSREDGEASTYQTNEDNYTALEPPPLEIYARSLLETDIEVILPYDSKGRMDVTAPFYQISYYDGLRVEEIAEPEASEETDREPLFTAAPPVAEEEPDETPDPQMNLEARLGFRN